MPKGWFSGEGLLFPPPRSIQTEQTNGTESSKDNRNDDDTITHNAQQHAACRRVRRRGRVMSQPHVQLRNALLDDHVKKGWMDAYMVLAYAIMLRHCDWKTGIWHGSADSLAALTGGQWSKATAVRSCGGSVKVATSRPTTSIRCGAITTSPSTTLSPPSVRMLARNYAAPRRGIIASGSPVTLINGLQIRITSDPVRVTSDP